MTIRKKNCLCFCANYVHDDRMHSGTGSIGEAHYAIDWGFTMDNAAKAPSLTADGVAFTVWVDYKSHDCLVSPDALSNLGQMGDKELDLMATYTAYETKIAGVARRLVAAGVVGSPIFLGPRYFK